MATLKRGNIVNLRPFQKGNPGGPGRPKSSLLKVLAEYGEKRKAGKSNAQALAALAWKKALGGDLEWAEWLADRILGKPAQAVDFTSDERPVVFTLSLGAEGKT